MFSIIKNSLIVCILLIYSCSDPKQSQNQNYSSSVSTQKAQIKKRSEIRNEISLDEFLNLSNNTTEQEVVNYLRKSGFPYDRNPDFLKNHNNLRNSQLPSPSYGRRIDFYPQVLYTPSIKVGNLQLYDSFIGFYKDTIAFFVTQVQHHNELERSVIDTLQNFYFSKYGTPTRNDTANNPTDKRIYIVYRDEVKDISAYFYKMIEGKSSNYDAFVTFKFVFYYRSYPKLERYIEELDVQEMKLKLLKEQKLNKEVFNNM